MPASGKNNIKDMVVRFDNDNKKLVRKLGKSKSEKLVKFKKLSKSENLLKFYNKETGPSFLTSNTKIALNYL